MDIKIEKTTYKVKPITPNISPILKRIGELIQAPWKDLETAKKTGEELGSLCDLVFSETVSPKPAKEHQMQLLQTVINLTSQEMDEADCFRKKK